MTGNPFSEIPTSVRRWAYVVYTLLLTALGAIQVGFGATSADTPDWLTVAFAVMGYLGIAFGFTAASNVHHEDPAWAVANPDAAAEVPEHEDDPEILSEIEMTDPNIAEGDEPDAIDPPVEPAQPRP